MNRKLLAIAAALVMAAGLLTGCGDSVRSIDEREKEYDLYIFNTGGESEQGLKVAVNAWSDEVGMKIKLWSPETGDDAEAFLKSEMGTDGQPGLYWVRDDAAVQQWVDAGKALDLNAAGGSIAQLAGSIPEQYRLTVAASGDAASEEGEAQEPATVGIPAGLEGFGLIVDKEVLAALFGEENVGAWLDAYRTATYEEWEGMVVALNKYVKKGEKGTVTLSGKEFPLADKKQGAAAGLNAVFALAGTETWVYAEYLLDPAMAAIFPDAAAARGASADKLESGRGNIEAYAETLWRVCANSIPGRGDNLVNPEKASYGEQIKNFAEGKAVFLVQSSRAYARLRAASTELSERLAILPVKMRFNEEAVLTGMSADQLNNSIPIYVPGYFVINAQASERERRLAAEFLVWLNTSDTGRKFLAEEIALVSATAQSASDCDTSLGSSVCSYIESGMTLPYVMNGCPDLWAENDLGTYLMKNYLSQKKWRDDTYEDIANFCVSSWAEHQ